MSRLKSLTSSWSNSFKLQVVFLCIGVLLVVVGLIVKSNKVSGSSSVEVLNTPTLTGVAKIVVDVSGAVVNPGVYNLSFGSRVEDALVAAGGLTNDVDESWVNKSLNRAAKVIDGQKIFIPFLKQSSSLSATVMGENVSVAQSYSEASGDLVNINTAGLKELDKLPGIGQVYGQNIIDNRPYSDVKELLDRGVLKESVFEKIRTMITVY